MRPYPIVEWIGAMAYILHSKRNHDRSCTAKVMDVACWPRINLSCCDAETVPNSLSVKKRIVIPSYFLRIMLVPVRGIGAVCVSDQPGDKAILSNQMVSDRRKLGGCGQMTYWATFVPEGLKS
ncbi:hypothetical protein Bca52824_035122 [Brassica carinata]|uniref:Uncharacterized protein n=1 Tax=Brassica carinata TaxID=52824 RepID=A0A8X7V087_BRACI|nr:hypothetical protein Bca52824_035122 [Brassica carinata]